MVRHIILWKLKEVNTEEEKQEILKEIKDNLEGLQGQIPGLIKIQVQTEKLKSSSADVMLFSEFTDEAALNGYSVHPAHVEVANAYVRPFVEQRSCLDFEV